MAAQSQHQSLSRAKESSKPQSEQITVPSTPPNPAKAETSGREELLDDGRTVRGGEAQPVRPERDVEGRDHGAEDAFALQDSDHR